MNIHLIDYFERTVDSYPSKLAIADHETSLSFDELRKKARLIATQISRVTTTINTPIAIYLPKCTVGVAACLGALYSGNCYAPLDPKNPGTRIKSILQQLNPSCIITTDAYIAQLLKHDLSVAIINLDDLDYSNLKTSTFDYTRCIDTDPAYIIHTSGSTGVPKGVAISHRSIFDYIHWAIDTFEVTEDEIIGNQAPLIFDNSTLDIYLMVFTGATLYLIPEQMFMFPAKLLDYLKEKNINFIFWVPSVLINITNYKLLDNIELPSLKKILFAGEVMPTKHLNYWISNFADDVTFANLYGPTEITVDCTYYIIDRAFEDHEAIPIGKPCRNSDILILNENDALCQKEEQGELCVRGSSLALGYWNDFEKTASVFVQNPLNTSYPEKIYRTGDVVFLNEREEIVFVGRKDFQIKHLGNRIELGEVENAVLSVFDAINPCVLYDESRREIVLIYESAFEIPTVELRIKLSKVLPKYMLPTRYIKIDQLPFTTSGKTDRAYLKKIAIL